MRVCKHKSEREREHALEKWLSAEVSKYHGNSAQDFEFCAGEVGSKIGNYGVTKSVPGLGTVLGQS